MLTKILYILVFVATNILCYNVGYLQALSDFYGELREQIRYEQEHIQQRPRGPAADLVRV